eukprot:jgi/Chrpa1/23065/Chrysochromulina_OHIO_Genome00008421-RA
MLCPSPRSRRLLCCCPFCCCLFSSCSLGRPPARLGLTLLPELLFGWALDHAARGEHASDARLRWYIAYVLADYATGAPLRKAGERHLVRAHVDDHLSLRANVGARRGSDVPERTRGILDDVLVLVREQLAQQRVNVVHERTLRPLCVVAQVLNEAACKHEDELVARLEEAEDYALHADLQQRLLRKHRGVVHRVRAQVAEQQQCLLVHLDRLVRVSHQKRKLGQPVVFAHELAEARPVLVEGGAHHLGQRKYCHFHLLLHWRVHELDELYERQLIRIVLCRLGHLLSLR